MKSGTCFHHKQVSKKTHLILNIKGSKKHTTNAGAVRVDYACFTTIQ